MIGDSQREKEEDTEEEEQHWLAPETCAQDTDPIVLSDSQVRCLR